MKIRKRNAKSTGRVYHPPYKDMGLKITCLLFIISSFTSIVHVNRIKKLEKDCRYVVIKIQNPSLYPTDFKIHLALNNKQVGIGQAELSWNAKLHNTIEFQTHRCSLCKKVRGLTIGKGRKAIGKSFLQARCTLYILTLTVHICVCYK